MALRKREPKEASGFGMKCEAEAVQDLQLGMSLCWQVRRQGGCSVVNIRV